MVARSYSAIVSLQSCRSVACFATSIHTSVTYGRHGMVQQQQMRCHGCKPHEFWLRFGWVLRKFWQRLAKKWTWLGRDGPPGACFTSKHHSLVTYGGHGMVQQQQMRCHGCKPHEFWLRAVWVVQKFWQGPAKQWTYWLGRDGPPGACFTTKHH